MNRIAYFGGTFDPVHNGHLSVARALVSLFRFERFFFLPAFHAPHKPDRLPTSGYHRFAMLSLATQEDEKIGVSTFELDKHETRYTIDTLAELHSLHPGRRVFFVMGADSWVDIRTWRNWENVLTASDIIVVTRPGYEISFDHVSDIARGRIVDLRSTKEANIENGGGRSIYITDAVRFDTSATELRSDLRDGQLEREDDIPVEVAKYIEKYELYR